MKLAGHQRGRMSAVGAGAALLCLLLTAAGRAEGKLTTADVVRFLRAGISEPTILTELEGRGYAGPLDGPAEAELRAAGATETLLVALRRAAPPPVAPPALPTLPAPDRAPTPANLGSEPTFAAGTRTVRVPVAVLDKEEKPVLGLEQKDFRVIDDGKTQPVTLFSQERRPLRIALALDTSRSMEDKIRQVEEALTHFIDLLEPADQILVLTFNDQVHVIQDFTSDREALRQVLDRLEPRGGTALYDAAFEAVRRVAEGPAESKAVVLVTDGVDTASSISLADLRETARRAEVPVFSIGLDVPRLLHELGGGGHHRPGGWPGGHGGGMGGGWGGWGGGGGGGGHVGGPRGGSFHRQPETFDAKPLTDLADDTGGTAQILKGLEHYTPGSDEPPGSEKLKAAVESIATILRYRYLLGYEPPESKKAWRTIKVEVDRPDAVARARKGYYAGD
jgi:VWFA-related protein